MPLPLPNPASLVGTEFQGNMISLAAANNIKAILQEIVNGKVQRLIKIVIGITLIECGVNLFLITLGYREKSIAPIYTGTSGSGIMSLPVPQALTLTSIVIGVAVLALMLSLVVYIYKHYGTLDARKIGREKE